MPTNPDLRNNLLRRWEALKTERSSFWAHWQEITTYIMPWNGRYFRQDRDKGRRRANAIYDNTGIRALKTLGAGLMSGATSPARPWFRLGVPDPDLNSYQPVKLWLDDVTTRMHQVFQKSNTYRALQQVYEELGAFGTGASIVLPDFDNIIHHYPLTVGEYAIATDAQGKVCTLYREFEMTVSAMVKEFGYAECSPTVQTLYDGGKGLDQWIPVIHAIEPRADRDPSKKDNKNMAWGSYYFESGEGNGQMLRESGFRNFPAICPRWSIAGGDIYGNSPGMEALGDVKQLQHEQLRKANAIDYQTNPPLQVPVAMKNVEINRLPGGTTYYDGSSASPIKSAFDVNLNLQDMLSDIQDCRDRIKQSFFSDVFMMLANSTNPQMTATEVAERQEEKMLMMGPVLERINNEALQPLVETTFTHMMEVGMIPQSPQEMQGQPLNIEFIGILAQAQKSIATNSVDRFVQSMTTVAQVKPEVLDNFDPDAWAATYSDMMGINPKLIVPSDQVQATRQAKAKAQAAQEQAQAMQQQSVTAKNLAQSPTSGGASNALNDLMNQYSGYGSPSPQEVGQ
jgi:hypothetical protein